MIRRKDTRYRLRYKGPKKGNCLAPVKGKQGNCLKVGNVSRKEFTNKVKLPLFSA